ncbi:class I adenylate-forming enzyme family protein [Roseibium sp. SCP14]|uniref:class I adenylate-forming enzyme family protein n=1 Tax=Roseibium sp. SCP14 TaxID=3141375 RepID=UPI00333A3B6F
MLHGSPLEEAADLRSLISPHVREKPDAYALTGSDARLTWQELDTLSNRLAGHYVSMELSPGCVVASLMPNRSALIVHYLACVKAGLVAMPLNYRYTASEIDHALAKVKPAMMIVHSERVPEIEGSEEAGKLPQGLFSFEGDQAGADNSLEWLLSEEAKDFSPPKVTPDAPAFILFTSGSTGKPKGVTHSLTTFGYITSSFAEALAITPDDVLLAASSASHMGSIKLSLSSLWAGAEVCLAPTFDAEGLLPLLRANRPTVSLILPAALFGLIRDTHSTPGDFKSLRLVMSGGDKLSAELEKEFTEIAGIPINEAYGMTEIGTSHLNPPYGVNKLGSVGLNNPGYTSALRDIDGEEVPIGVEGQHWVKSPCMMTGYWNDRDATDRILKMGWLDSGDIMRADEDGYLWFCGRRKQIIIHDGSNINPQDVEGALMDHPSIAYAGVVGVDDLVHGQNVWAFVTLKNDMARPNTRDLLNFARARVGYKAPEAIVFLESLPLTAVGKLNRPRLSQMAAAMMAGNHA